jgi:hypothetical protein
MARSSPHRVAAHRAPRTVRGYEGRSDGAIARTYAPRTLDIDTIDAELRLVATLRRAARERGGPLPSIDEADALLDERGELTGLPRPTRCLVDY